MSIRIMTMVWDRYPATGGELLLALAIADHAHDNGCGIYAGVETLAHKTRQSIRTVQYQLKAMRESGWLIKVGKGDGGRSRHVTYHINPKWLKGAEVAPFVEAEEEPQADEAEEGASCLGEPENTPEGPPDLARAVLVGGDGVPPSYLIKGATTAAPFSAPEAPDKGCNLTHKRVQQLLHPSIKPDEPYISPLPPHEGVMGVACGQAEQSKQVQVTAQSAKPEGGKGSRKRSGPITLRTYVDACSEAGVKPVPEGCKVFEYADEVGIPREILSLHWQEFRERHMEADKRQKDWLRTLLNSVKGNWYGLWTMSPDGGCSLSTKGRQAEAWHRRDKGRAA